MMESAALEPPSYWADLYRDRWDWGFRMLHEFRSQMQVPEFADLFGNDNSAAIRVVVYGKTRVGKTTLIFKLLGIDERTVHDGETSLTRLGRILRGNTAKEQAGTSSAVIYRRSVDDNFYLIRDDTPETGPYDEAGIEACLQRLRTDVEGGIFRSLTPVLIDIPRSYFDPRCAYPHLTVIDIPGTGSSIQGEQEHVNNILHNIVQFATMTLLVEEASSLQALARWEIPGLGSWLRFQNRVRLVLTYAVSDRSTRDRVCRTGGDREAYLQIFREDLRRALGSSGHALKEGIPIFPLEYGESWQNLRTTDEPLWRRMSEVLTSLIDDLVEEVRRASSNDAAFLLYMEQENSIREMTDERLLEFDSELEGLEGAIESVLTELDSLQRRLRPLQDCVDDIESKRQLLTRTVFEAFKVDGAKAPALGYFERPSALDDHCAAYRVFLEQEAGRHCCNELEKSDLSFLPSKLKSHLAAEFERMAPDDWRGHADDPSAPYGRGCMDGSYCGWLFDETRKKRDHEAATNAFCVALRARAEEAAAGFLAQAATDEETVLLDRLKSLREQVQAFGVQIAIADAKRRMLQADQEEVKTHRQRFVERSQADLEAARLFVHRLKEALNEECRTHLKKAEDPAVPAEYKVLELAYVHCLTGEVNAKLSGRGW